MGKKRGYSGGTATDLDRVPLPTVFFKKNIIIRDFGNQYFFGAGFF
jgi:hypothetical protein